jgi:hypothetical protein
MICMVGTLAAPWPLLPDSIKLKILSADHVYIQPSIDRCNHLIYILYILANKYHAVRVQICRSAACIMHAYYSTRPASSMQARRLRTRLCSVPASDQCRMPAQHTSTSNMHMRSTLSFVK